MIPRSLKAVLLTAALIGAPVIATPAAAAVTLVSLGTNLLATPSTSFSFDGATFTFSATRDLFNPLRVQSSATGALSAFGGFLNIPLVPSPSFTNRGTVTYGPAFGQFASFASPTTVGASNGNNFIGLRATVGSDNYYGFAYTTGSILNGFGFETTPNTAITATTALAPVPEPNTWILTILGFGVIGATMRRRAAAAPVPA